MHEKNNKMTFVK